MDDLSIAVARILKDVQSESGPSYTKLAAASGLSRPTIERILNARRPANLNQLRRLCLALDLEITQVIDDAENSL